MTDNKDGDKGARWDWPSVALFVIFVAAFVYALWSR